MRRSLAAVLPALLLSCTAPLDSRRLNLLDLSGQPRPAEELLSSQLNVVLLVSPGRECIACLGIAQIWRKTLEGWPEERVRIAYVVAAQPDAARKWVPRLREDGAETEVWLDPENGFRGRFGLEAGPFVAGVSARGRLKFALPITADLWRKIAFEKEFIENLVRESLSP